MEGAADTVNADRHPLVLLVSACFWVIMWILSWTKSLIAFVTITIPTMIYFILSYSMTLTLNFWSFALIFTLFAIVLNYWIRFRYLNDYTQLKEPPLVKPDANELHPDVNTEPPPSFHNYLDDFLQAVRVFGFLEKPVFHELARHLQTRRLIAGDSISLDEDKSFYCVIDGQVQVFSQTGQIADQQGAWDNEDVNGYQLLNEVGSGGTLSSLFTILSLFTEDVKMSWQDDHVESPFDTAPLSGSRSRRTSSRSNADISVLELGTPGGRRSSSTSSAASTVHITSHMSPGREGHASPSEDDHDLVKEKAIYHGLVARATEDTTLAVIPAEAFRRLTKKYPKATGHIVQVILTRFSRVTFNAAHKYLGLTSEVIRTEKVINDIACHPLPASFYEEGGLQYLRTRFDSTDRSETDSDYFSYPHFTNSPASISSKSLSNESVSKASEETSAKNVKIVNSSRPTFHNNSTSTASSFPIRPHNSRHVVQAGDLLTSTDHPDEPVHRGPMNRSNSIVNTPHPTRKPLNYFENRRAANTSGDDFDLREEVMSCIAKSIGLLQPPISGGESGEASPAVKAADDFRLGSERLFTSFSSLSLLDLNDDVSSATGGSSTLPSPGGYMVGLDNEVEILFFAAGSTLVKAGEMNKGLFYVIDGFLEILLPPEFNKNSSDGRADINNNTRNTPKNRGESKLLFDVKPGGIAGYLASLTHTVSYVDIRAKTNVYVGFLHSNALERILEKRPIVLLTLAKRLISLLSPLVLHIDASLDWMQVNAGQVLWRPDDKSDSFYIVINGRVRVITENIRGGLDIVGEFGQGDTVGELDVITSSTRRNTAHAIRDTELIRMPQTLFNAISARNPQTTAQLLRTIASRVREEVHPSPTRSRPSSELGYNNNLKTVAVLPVSRSVPIETFSKSLQKALEGIGALTAHLNQASMSSHLGRHAFTRMGKLKAAGWLADMEQKYRIVLYVVDSSVNSPWTQTCIRQADYVMVVGMGDDPSLGEYERLLLSMKTTARKELVLVHPDRSVLPGSTREWLKNRPWIHQHLHVELPGIVMPIPKSAVPKDPDPMSALKNLKDKVQNEIQKYRGGAHDPRPQRLPHTNDFSRLARRLCGKSIGLVLGGGGARGISHLGLIRALQEYNIPIDHIGGTSIGALIGGLYAREGDILSSAARAKHFSSRMGNIWRILSDVTYPIVAYTTGHEFNRALYKAFYDLHIEDMWIPFYCNTTNITTSTMEIHETGYAWRFIRASMTLVGLLPPLCDNGSMLVDGGYVDNLPVAAMFSKGASAVFACDVGSLDDNSPRDFGDHVSGWWLLINRWNPFSSAKRVPAITEIQSRLAYVSSVKTLEEAKVAPDCIYLSMPVQDYGTLQFNKFEEIQKKGYHSALEFLGKCADEGMLPSAFIDGRDGTESTTKGRSARRNSI
ncbi:hypothetical protein GGU10DRAFT_283246 [Lentinula aff. detonsa]|uniref:Lysophospholipase NTE1 n=1 Tax=Lentinula aff. detonsa TaxID=2804958 RepID=A0AA38NRU5_9AGAR|nr:hypothetical protein GGU10DRAFT_283246 [Lentinula aff. detonsa]